MKRLPRWPLARMPKRLLPIVGITLGVFVLANVLVWGIYSGRLYPRTRIGSKPIGTLRRDKVGGQLDRIALLPLSIQLTYKDQQAKLAPAALGLQIDKDKTVKAALAARTWLPLYNLFISHDATVAFKVDQSTFQKTADSLASTFKKDPVDAKVIWQNATFAESPAADGYILDTAALQRIILTQAGAGMSTITVPTKVIAPKVQQKDILGSLQEIQAQQKVSLTYQYEAKQKKLSPAEVGTLYAPAGATFALSDGALQHVITQAAAGFGMRIRNLAEAVAATKDALTNKKPLVFTFVPAPVARKSFTYCVATRGAVDASYIAGLKSKLATVLNDSRGWAIGDQVAFTEGTSGCNFVVWLASADQMPTFGAICDSTWSCSVSPNVVINYDRWRNASPAWNQSGGSLEDYRAMVINHETGHWLGFGHSNCPGAGAAAPVMQQQSIALQGCVFNPWPTAAEQARLKQSLGL